MNYDVFRTSVADFVDATPRGRTMLANAFEVAESTVERWLNGVSRPMPRIQAQIVKWIAQQVQP